ncbi:CHAT domain-containing protein [Morchella snyderi]|nr:CHAT domain-containing protein [Morchella snyderi]
MAENMCETLKATGDDDPAAVEKVISLLEGLILSAPSPNLRTLVHAALIAILGRTPDRKRTIENIESDIENTRNLLKEMPQHDIERESLMSILGTKIFGKYKVSGAKGDLDEAIQIVLEAGNSMRCDHPCRRVTVKILEIMTESRTLLGEGAGEEEVLAKETETSGWDAVAAPQQPGGKEITENTMKDGTTDASPSTDIPRSSETYIQQMLDAAAQHDSSTLCSALTVNELIPSYIFENSDNQEPEFVAGLDGEPARNLPPEYNEHRPERLSKASVVLFIKYQRLKQPEYLNQAIDLSKEAVATTAPSNSYRLRATQVLVGLMQVRYELLGADDDLAEMIHRNKEIVTEMLEEDSDREVWLQTLAILTREKYFKSKRVEDLEQALVYAKELVDRTDIDHEDLPQRRDTLVNLHILKYRQSEDIKDLERAIEALESSITSPEHRFRLRHIILLSNCLEIMHLEFKREGCRDRAINMLGEASPAPTDGGPIRLTRWFCLFEMSSARFADLQDFNDYERSIHYANKILALPELGASERAIALAYMSRTHWEYYMLSAEVRILEEAITAGKMSVEIASAEGFNDPRYQLSDRLRDLGGLYTDRYNRYGEFVDLETSVGYLEKAISLDNSNPSVELLMRLSSHYKTRFELLGGLDDLDRSIKLCGQALSIMAASHRGQAVFSAFLGSLLISRYDQRGNKEDLETALEMVQMASQLEPQVVDHLPGCLSLLSVIRREYKKSNNQKELLDAIQACKTVPVDTVDKNRPLRRSGISVFMSVLLLDSYNESQNMQDLEDSIKYSEEVVAQTPRNNPRRAANLLMLGTAIHKRYSATQSNHDLYYALSTFYEAWHCRLSPVEERIRAAALLCEILAEKHMWQELSPVLQSAIMLLPNVSKRSLRRRDQEHHLAKFRDLAVNTIPFLLKAGEDAACCLRILEFGRGVIMGMVMDYRSETAISNLKEAHPDLFTKFKRLCKEIDQPLSTEPPMAEMLDQLRDRRSTHLQDHRDRETSVRSMEELVADIRDLPGFEGFQLPPRSDELMAMASEGPIVTFLCTKCRSDAIIVTATSIKSLRLPQLIYEDAEAWMSKISTLVRSKRSNYGENNSQMEKLLSWLWDSAVAPVLNELQLMKMSGDKLPRVWWIGTGVLARAPFHAAGRHSRRSTENTYSHVISSYIPTIKALSYARRRKLQLLSRPDSSLLVVTMPTTPPQRSRDTTRPPRTPGPLKSALEEASAIMRAAAGKTSVIQLNHPSAESIMTKLSGFQAVHFACHAVSDSTSPSQSCLLLNGGTGMLDTLTVEKLSAANIENAQIAYLSACSTAENSSRLLADESIHIASAFQLAGFSHVLATQWVSNDIACREVAEEFYKQLFKGSGGGGGDHGHVSLSFHLAVNKLRVKCWKEPIKWACYIHTGA